MSGLAGTLRFDGQEASESDVRRMADRMAHRGPDGVEAWVSGPVAVAHLRLAVTPEDLRERQPAHHGPSGITLVADLRLDAREDLAHQLGLDRAAVGLEDGPTDADLLLQAYLTWGHETPEHLYGDFAFAVWDPRDRTVFAAVDPFSVRTLYYHDAPGRLFAFASEAKALLALGEIPDAIDTVRLAHYLSGTRTDLERSIFDSIRAVAPAQAIVASSTGVRRWTYYEIAPGAGLGPLQGDDGVDAFRETFDRAVGDRVRSAFPVGAQLSGGLDSSSIAVVARDALRDRDGGPLHTFTLTFDATPTTDERAYAQAVIDQGGFVPHRVPADDLSPLGNIAEVYSVLDDGLVGGTQHQGWALLLAARDAGVRVVMDGFDGDTVVGHGDSLLREAAERGDWRAFNQMAHAMNAHYKRADHVQGFQEAFGTFAGVFGQYGWPVLVDQAAFGSRTRLLRSVWTAQREETIDGADAVRKLWRTLLRPRGANLERREASWRVRPGAVPRFVDAAFAERNGVDLSPSTMPRMDELGKVTLREFQRDMLAGANVQGALRTPAQLAAAMGFDLTHPFFDRRVVELCLALPAELSFADGWTRFVLRKALDGRLPDAVAWRVGKARMTPAVDRALRVHDADRLRQLADDPGWVAEYLDMDRLRRYARLDEPLPDIEMTHLAWISTAILWLNQQWPEGPGGASVWRGDARPSSAEPTR